MKRVLLFAICGLSALGARMPWDERKQVSLETLKPYYNYERDLVQGYGGWGINGPSLGMIFTMTSGFQNSWELSPFGAATTLAYTWPGAKHNPNRYYGFGGSVGVLSMSSFRERDFIPRFGLNLFTGFRRENGFIEVGLYEDGLIQLLWMFSNKFYPPMPTLKVGINF